VRHRVPIYQKEYNIMHAKVSIKGQIVIPAELREKYAIAPGDTVDVRDGDGKILVFPLLKDAIQTSRGFLQGGTSLTAALLKARSEDDSLTEPSVSPPTAIVHK
jgi:AbrB family looped-hinge helix DNA binding protein